MPLKAKKTAEVNSLLADREGKRNRGASIPRYRHEEIAIRFAVLLYAYAGISSHQVPKVMELSNLLWDGVADEIPSHVTVLEWVEKCGLSIAKGFLSKRTAREAYSLIIDNSITICGQELHLELQTSSVHPGHPHKHADVSVVKMVAGNCWNQETTRKELDKTITALDRRPDYVVCDNGRTMCKASEGMDIPTHRDISH